VQTNVESRLKRIGTVKPRTALEVGTLETSRSAVKCCHRDYGNFENFKEAGSAPLGIVRIRLNAGGQVRNPAWHLRFRVLDRQVDNCSANGLEVLLETSYGKPDLSGGRSAHPLQMAAQR
jgi:hypothetical protein